MKRIIMSIPVVILMLSACANSVQGIEAKNAWARPAMMDGNGAVYFTLQNHSADQDALTGVSSGIAEAVEMHETKMEGDVMQMQQVMSIPLPGNGKVQLAPGGLHIMLIGVKQDLKAGDEIEITLQFENHDDITLTVPVQEMPGDDSMGSR